MNKPLGKRFKLFLFSYYKYSTTCLQLRSVDSYLIKRIYAKAEMRAGDPKAGNLHKFLTSCIGWQRPRKVYVRFSGHMHVLNF